MVKNNIQSVDVTKQIQDDYLNYAIQTLNRALPSAIDGLKVSQRRIMQIMKYYGYTSSDKFSKVMKVSGMVTGLLHPHSGAEGTIISMGDPSITPYKLTNIHGNIGGVNPETAKRISSDSPAAARYLECKLSDFGDLVFDNKRRHLRTGSSYDGQTEEILEFVPKLPIALLMGNVGISVGYATKMAPYKLIDIIDVTTQILTNSDSIDIPKISFPSGCYVLKDQGYKDYLLYGKGNITVQGKWICKRDGSIVINELPFVDAETFCDKVKSAVSSGKLIIKDIRDYSKDGVDIHVFPSKGITQKQTIANLLATTPLEETFSGNNTVLVNGIPKVLSSLEIITLWIEARKKYIIDWYSYEKVLLEEKIHLINGYISACSKLDETINQIRLSKNKQDAIDRLVKLLNIDENQSKYIVELQLHTLSNSNKKVLTNQKKELKVKVKKYNTIINDPTNYIVSELEEIKQYSQPETTEVLSIDKWTKKDSLVKKVKTPSLKSRIRSHAHELGISDHLRNKFMKQDHKGKTLASAWNDYAKTYCQKKKIKYVKFELVELPNATDMAAMIKRINKWCKSNQYKGIKRKTFVELWKENGSEAAIRKVIAKENK